MGIAELFLKIGVSKASEALQKKAFLGQGQKKTH
jgi:hypothetical protein